MRQHHKDFLIMHMHAVKNIVAIIAIPILLLFSDPAEAFRCKSKLVTDGMHEQQVRAICGEPTTARNLGYTVRGVYIGYQNQLPGGWSSGRRVPGGAHLGQEVVITEYVYNFGPRKLMRRLIFEGGVLVSIESIGYGYREKK